MNTRRGARGWVAAAVLLAWLAGLGMLTWRQLFRPNTEQLAEAGLRVTPGASFYAVLQHGRQIGFASSTIDTVGREITVQDYLVADLPVGGEAHRASARTDVTMSRALRVLHFTLDVDAALTPVNASGTVVGDSLLLLVVKTQAGQPADTQRIRLSGPILLPTLVPLAVALGERPKVGKSYTLPIFDPSSMSPRDTRVRVEAESVFVLNDSSIFNPATRRWVSALPDTVRGWRLATARDHASGPTNGFTGWVDEQGRVIRSDQMLGLTLERRPYEVAYENWRAEASGGAVAVAADRDILETTAIAANKTLKRNLAQLKVRLSGADLSDFDVKGYRQHLRGDTLTIDREGLAAMTSGYRLPNGARSTVMGVFLDAEPLVESANPEIVRLARRLSGTEIDPRVVAERINRWVHDSVHQAITVGVPSALTTLHSRSGDCNELTQLYVALARAAGIPARVASGLALVDGKFYYHAWPEIFLNLWLPVDPTFNQFPADASHLRFVVGGLGKQAALLRLMGNLRIDVLSSR